MRKLSVSIDTLDIVHLTLASGSPIDPLYEAMYLTTEEAREVMQSIFKLLNREVKPPMQSAPEIDDMVRSHK